MRDRIAAFLWRNLNVFNQSSILQETLRQRLVDDLEVIVTEELDRRERAKTMPPTPISPPKPHVDLEPSTAGCYPPYWCNSGEWLRHCGHPIPD